MSLTAGKKYTHRERKRQIQCWNWFSNNFSLDPPASEWDYPYSTRSPFKDFWYSFWRTSRIKVCLIIFAYVIKSIVVDSLHRSIHVSNKPYWILFCRRMLLPTIVIIMITELCHVVSFEVTSCTSATLTFGEEWMNVIKVTAYTRVILPRWWYMQEKFI